MLFIYYRIFVVLWTWLTHLVQQWHSHSIQSRRSSLPVIVQAQVVLLKLLCVIKLRGDNNHFQYNVLRNTTSTAVNIAVVPVGSALYPWRLRWRAAGSCRTRWPALWGPIPADCTPVTSVACWPGDRRAAAGSLNLHAWWDIRSTYKTAIW